MNPERVLAFWFAPAGAPDHGRLRRAWFAVDAAFDDEIRGRFSDLHAKAIHGQLEHWRATPRGTVAYIVLLDQLSRNMFRGEGRAFSADAQARAATMAALERGDEKDLVPIERMFLYMPLMHSEQPIDQELSVELFRQLSEKAPHLDELRYAVAHRDLIARFGRFPHRNGALGRLSTPAEIAFLTAAGSTAP